ncbi:N-acetylglucosaminyl-phosphatidylinositol biosynthetic protein gpi1 [Lucilia sericata]|uniref:N-acetylglucosaminyl-phosphatidylinositol biosynthetic protein gpi1 n=1 Tax=Lucilia sericata TaxID=13632 RepID=UPI0018A8459A|nr:N-acetylglucosaminyl-phosphatidylinositol biosynthetic protein gpi1 [Lucilia sericata]
MTIKLFLPENLFYIKKSCDIYGEIKIGEQNCISYYIICAVDIKKPSKNDEDIEDYERAQQISNEMRHLGHIANATEWSQLHHKDVALVFVYDAETPNIYLNKLSIKTAQKDKINVFLYSEKSILKLQDLNESVSNVVYDKEDNAKVDADVCPDDDMHMLYQLLQTKDKFKLECDVDEVDETFKRVTSYVLTLPFDIFMWTFGLFMTKAPFRFVFQYSVMYDYYKEWLKFKKSGKRKYNIALDILLGLCVNILLILYIENPGDYIITASNSVVTNFRLLLQSLQGSPVGLKLNVQLNKFLLDCFGYHVELWATFLVIIEPCIRQLLTPIILLGFIGFSYQLALLTDLISVMGLHAHCFSIYAAVLYKVEIKGLQVLWKVVLGKRKNVLKNRVESHNYKNRQLYLATVFFTSLLFLFPTVLTYYVVFTSLRLCIILVNYLLKHIRRNILEFPMEMLLRWCMGNFYDTDSLQLEFVHHTPSPLLQSGAQIQMCVFKLCVHSSSLGRVFSCHSGILQELVAKEENSIKSVCQRILQGTF